MEEREDIAIKALYRAALRLDPYLPRAARGKSIGTRIAALHSMARKSYVSSESLKGLTNQITRHMKATSEKDVWLKTSYYMLLCTVRSIQHKNFVINQKQHRIPVCMITRFAPNVKQAKGRSPILAHAKRAGNGSLNVSHLPAGDEFIYSIPAMNHPAVEQFFSLIEGNSYMNGEKSNDEVYKKLAFVMLQRVRMRSETSKAAGQFLYIWRSIEEEFRRVNSRDVVILSTKRAFPISLNHMARRVKLSDGEVVDVFPHRKHSVLLMHNGLSELQLHRAIAIARRGSIYRPLLQGQAVYGLDKAQIQKARTY